MNISEEIKYQCTGYHGTDSVSGDKIVQSQKFLKSCDEEEWLGDGAYFFENDKKQAVYFITKAKKINNYKIISANIQTNKLLDLIDSETYENFEKFAKMLRSKYLKTKDNKPRRLMNSVILNTMYRLEPYDVVRGVFKVPMTQMAPRTNIQPMQIQVCVREQKCISDIREV